MHLDAWTLQLLRLGAFVHDIRKIGISDNLLRKPAALTPDEYEVIKTHPAVGARILRIVRFFEVYLPIVELHHERPDGRGYPYGLKGEEIPVLARIVHVADAYDAMTSVRAYRPALPAAEALRELGRGAGTAFDADAVHALAAVLAREDLQPASSDGLNLPSEAASPGIESRVTSQPADPLDEFGSEGRVA